MKIIYALIILLLMSSLSFAWIDTYDMLIQLIGFKPVHFYQSQNFAVEWVKENQDGSLTMHLVEIS